MSTKPDTQLPQPVSRSLTLPEQRLAGSAACLNCGTELKGPFCYYCGQPDKNFMRFFPVLMRELLEDSLDFDSRFMRTIKPLIFKPGKLTRDYLDGRRFRYVPPLRLYIFSSIAFFFLAAMLAGNAIQITSTVDGEDKVVTGLHIGKAEDKDIEEALQGLEDINPELASKIEQDIQEAKENQDGDNSFNFNGEPWDRETNPLIIPFLPDWVNERINKEIEESPQKGREIEANPNLIKDKAFDVMPVTMFVLLPLVALLFKFWYLFAKKYYVEHLIFALHNHSFIFVALLLTMLLSSLAGWREPSEDGPLTSVVTWINIALWVWIPVYLMVSLKQVYRQGWTMTMTKFSMIGLSYIVLLSFATVFVALLSFVLL
jgi:hypothetical protein